MVAGFFDSKRQCDNLEIHLPHWYVEPTNQGLYLCSGVIADLGTATDDEGDTDE